MSTILVFGHRNPDTDAIAATIGLSQLEQALGRRTESVALGDPNAETPSRCTFAPSRSAAHAPS